MKVFGGNTLKLRSMFKTLHQRYGLVPALVDSLHRSPWADAVVICLLDFYAVFAPEKVINVPEIVRGLEAQAAASQDPRQEV